MNAAYAEQVASAERRFENQASERRAKLATLAQPGGIAAADTPERVAKRLDRLSRYYCGEPLPDSPAEVHGDPQELVARSVERLETLSAGRPDSAEAGAAAVLERIINTPDFVDVRYLEAGVTAARAVCRINIRDGNRRVVGYGTGSLVSRDLILTNHHVLDTPEVAATSGAEFNYQDAVDRQPVQPQVFELAPERLFIADQERDFALVALQPSPRIEEFGVNRLIEAEGKAIIGEFVTIVQHPRGEKKQVSLRENRIVDVLDEFLHYEADTEPGSSGSPVFNDQWEIVALHHASVPASGSGEAAAWMNEGIRISRIIKFIRAQAVAPTARSLIDALFSERISLPRTLASTREARARRPRRPSLAARARFRRTSRGLSCRSR